VGMWKSRVRCEISKRLWKSFCDFQSRVMSTAVPQSFSTRRKGGCYTLAGLPIVVPGASYAVVSSRRAARSQDPCEFYFAAASGRKSGWTFVRQLRGPHFSTWA
jgi:hypothetical protein